MSINQLSLIMVAVGISLRAWLEDPVLGVTITLICFGAIARAFIEIHWLRLQQTPIGSKRELALVASSTGVMILITGSTALALVLPIACLWVGAHVVTELTRFIPALPDWLSPPSSIAGFLVIPVVLFIYGSPIIGLALAVFTLGGTAFHLLPLRGDARARRRKGWKLASVWLAIVTTLGGLELGASRLESTRLIRESATAAAQARQNVREANACLDHLDGPARCPRCEGLTRAAVLTRRVAAAQEADDRKAETVELRAHSATSWQVQLMPAWLAAVALLAVLRWFRPRPALDPVGIPEIDG